MGNENVLQNSDGQKLAEEVEALLSQATGGGTGTVIGATAFFGAGIGLGVGGVLGGSGGGAGVGAALGAAEVAAKKANDSPGRFVTPELELVRR